MCNLVDMVNLCQRFHRETWTTPLATHSLFPIIYTLVYHDLIQAPEICPNNKQPLRYTYPHEVCWIVKHPQLVLQREIYISISIPYMVFQLISQPPRMNLLISSPSICSTWLIFTGHLRNFKTLGDGSTQIPKEFSYPYSLGCFLV